MSDNEPDPQAVEDEAPQEADTTTPQGTEQLAKVKAESRKWEKRAKQDLAKLKQLQDLIDSQNKDQESSTAAAANELAQARVQALRYRVAVERQLPPALAARLKGETEDEIAADADSLAELIIKPKAPPAGSGTGTQPEQSKKTTNELLQQMVRG